MINNLDKILEEKKMTAYALSKVAGVTPSAIYNYIKNGQTPALNIAMKIAAALNTQVENIWKL